MKSLIKKIMRKLGFRFIVDSSRNFDLDNIKLKSKHVKNLSVVVDRESLLKKLPKKGYVAELGVDQGNFSKQILTISNPQKLFLVDMWGSSRYSQDKMFLVEKKFSKEIESKKVELIRKSSDLALKEFKEDYFDWIYIDTTHSYEQTRKELEIGRFKVKKRGIIAGHDYCQGNFKKGLRYGVIRAVNEFCLKYNW